MHGALERTRLLHQLLTDRRSRIEPADVGLARPTGKGRRAKGLSQAQLDYLLGRPGTGTYARLERGAIERPEEWLLRAVATALRFSEHEWQALWAYAREEFPPHPLDPRADRSIIDSWQLTLDSCSSPAYITGVDWNLLAYNAPFVEFFESGEPPVNTMDYMMLTPEGRRRLADWENSWAPTVLAQLRAAAAGHPDDPTLRRLVQDVRNDPQAGPIFESDARALSHPDGDTRPFLHPVHGPGRVAMNAALLGGAPEARLIVVHFLPDTP